MSAIFFAIIVRDPDVVMAEFSKAQGNFPQITRNILPKLPRGGKFSYSYNSTFTYHYMTKQDLVFLCLADSAFSRRMSFLFLEDLSTRFFEHYVGVYKTLIAFGANADFSTVIRDRMVYFNTDPSADKVEALKASLDEVKNIMVDNIDKVLARGEKVELLVKKTEDMSQSAISMHQRAKQVRRKMWCRNVKMYLMLGGAVLVGVLLLAMTICSPDFSSC
jgi:vesicle-associated membrane protein 7